MPPCCHGLALFNVVLLTVSKIVAELADNFYLDGGIVSLKIDLCSCSLAVVISVKCLCQSWCLITFASGPAGSPAIVCNCVVWRMNAMSLPHAGDGPRAASDVAVRTPHSWIIPYSPRPGNVSQERLAAWQVNAVHERHDVRWTGRRHRACSPRYPVLLSVR